MRGGWTGRGGFVDGGMRGALGEVRGLLRSAIETGRVGEARREGGWDGGGTTAENAGLECGGLVREKAGLGNRWRRAAWCSGARSA